MVAADALLFIIGLVLAAMTLLDVFDTVIVPGGSRASLRVAKRLARLLLPLWKAMRGRRHGLSGTFAPLILVLCFTVWMALLATGFGLMAYAVRGDFKPPLNDFLDGIYIVGSSLVTVGLSESNPTGLARWVVLGAGFCGLAVMTMAVTYLLEVQGSVAERDIGIIKLNTAAGEPPSAVTLLQRFAAIENRDELRQVLRDGRDWCATVRQSHSNHPSLIYFQSVGTGAGWPAALGALLDLALLSEQCLDDKSLCGSAALLRDEGSRMGRELAGLIGIDPCDVALDQSELKQAAERLRSAGYAIRDDADYAVMAEQRTAYQSCVDALADHLGKPNAPLVRQD
ncbi:MAG TPA: ion channel [Sphingomicrobium sp.]